jgi:hypothetical protein
MEPVWFVSDSTGATNPRTKSSLLYCRGRRVLSFRGRRVLSCRGRRVLSCRSRRALSCRGRRVLSCPVVVVPPIPLVTELRVRSLTYNRSNLARGSITCRVRTRSSPIPPEKRFHE